ncbi:hypothetical protein MLD38_005060 [Melastoma candidum]|uniref:Uncharacterized protein n=1 Tax=Melastoma candidum TaxID=119954 RepID=A0ACB9S8Y9_9MYRT|nr:hypothetical protein MLD38_005060 [Melastoma candidum]
MTASSSWELGAPLTATGTSVEVTLFQPGPGISTLGYEDINHYEKAPGAKLAHPTPEHFYPLHVALGAAGENVVAKQIHHSWTKENLTKASYQFTQMD